MLYKRLLDDLLSPKFGWIPYIESRKLEPCLVFSDEFKARMIGLANTEKLADRIAHASCLLDLTFVWKATVDELQLAKIEVDKELSISYRRATQSTGEFPMWSVYKPWLISPNSGKTRSPERKGEVLGTKQVLYDEDFLQQKIELVSELIYGSRQPRGVSLQDTWRCESCEYKMDCEWREEQAELFTERYSKGPVSSFLVNQ